LCLLIRVLFRLLLFQVSTAADEGGVFRLFWKIVQRKKEKCRKKKRRSHVTLSSHIRADESISSDEETAEETRSHVYWYPMYHSSTVPWFSACSVHICPNFSLLRTHEIGEKVGLDSRVKLSRWQDCVGCHRSRPVGLPRRLSM
jgi:hypothetical protein